MIEQARLKNFKCFKDITLNVRPLTVLSGINGMGKSSFIQSLLLLRQSGGVDAKKAFLNGSLISLGYAEDIFYEWASEGEHIAFYITENSGTKQDYNFVYDYQKGSRELHRLGGTLQHGSHGGSCALWGERFFYLQAERMGPRVSFDLLSEWETMFNPIGNRGEYCASLLSSHERNPVEEGRCHARESVQELRAQVEAWFSEIGQVPRLHLNEHPDMDKVSLQFSFLRDNISSRDYRTTHVGFGLTYVLPIFVACLLVKTGGLVLIENPEAHLHPKGQAALGCFLAQVAASGVQIIIETHSDHILNGIRVAVKNKKFSHKDIALHFFTYEMKEQCSSVESPQMDGDGRLDVWPDGFFDEWEKALLELL